ncbi:unnamed protein product [Knipowitschia caucasica]|uniref:T-cell surface glycoprotein CD3 zeta chain n=1 Tax=Knipowitschia caucasica TaxID=637954 RepID=A0AAV2L6X4_KNICA
MRRLALLLLLPLSADGLSLYDPRLCFLLDGLLGLYGLFITAMFLREKFFGVKVKSDNKQHTSVLAQGQDSLYTGLTRREESEYRELPRRERRNEQLYQGLSAATRDTYDSLHQKR